MSQSSATLQYVKESMSLVLHVREESLRRSMSARGGRVCVCVHTHSLSVYGVHSEEEGGEEGQTGVVEHATITRVHEQTGHGTVKTHVDHMEVERGHSTQEDVQSDGEREREREIVIVITIL